MSLGFVILVLALLATATVSIAQPWVGVVAAYLFVVLVPQQVWWWHFEGLRPVFWIMIPTLIGFVFAFLRGDVTFEPLKNRRTVFVVLLWLFYTLSYFFGPYVDVGGPFRFTSPEWAYSLVNNIFVLYLLAAICIDDRRKLMALIYAFAGSGAYLIYWINMQYLSGQAYGRVSGPTNLDGGGIYADANNFAMLFVTVIPLLWYLGLAVERRLLRWFIWLIIPFGWHAIFLTGSRGGLVGIAVTLAVIVWRSRNRAFAALLIPVFISAYLWQAGDVMRDRATTIDDFETEASAAGRIQAWGAAAEMMKNYPITGVGLASFGPAFPDHSLMKPREAHNTFFQIAAESGIPAGLMYILIIYAVLNGLRRHGNKLKGAPESEADQVVLMVNEAVLASFIGLITCSFFLSLQLFEIFYLLCVLANAIIFVTQQPIRRR